MKKNLFRWLVALAVVLPCLLLTAAAANRTVVDSGYCGGEGDGTNLTWTLYEDGELTISGAGSMQDYKALRSAPWYPKCSGLEKVTIGDGVTSIGDCAFYACTSITDVTISDSVKRIGQYAFSVCAGLSAVNFLNSVTTIDYRAFYTCKGVTSVTIPSSVTTVGEGAFARCDNLTEITVVGGATTIGGYAFYDCNSLTTVNLGNGVTSIGMAAFMMCDKLATVTIPNSMITIGLSAFDGCNALTSITIPESVTSVGGNAFCCDNLTRATFLSSATVFGVGVFHGCEELTIYGLSGSTAQTYANENSIPFVAIVVPTVPAKPHNIVNTVSGVHVYWKAVAGAEKYGLWRSETGKNGTYKWVANPTVPHFTDTKVESGKTYFYKVTSMYAGKHTDKSEALGIAFLSTPDFTARYNKAAGIKLEWNQITGATGYRIYRKSYAGNDAWVKVGEVTGEKTLNWTDESVKSENGTEYRYTVRAVKNGTLSGCRNTGRTMVRLASRVLNSATKASATSIKCSWTTSKAVTGYEVRFVVDGQVIKTVTIGNYKTGVKTFTGLTTGQQYQVQVRAYKKVDGVGSFYSAWSTAKYVQL